RLSGEEVVEAWVEQAEDGGRLRQSSSHSDEVEGPPGLPLLWRLRKGLWGRGLAPRDGLWHEVGDDLVHLVPPKRGRDEGRGTSSQLGRGGDEVEGRGQTPRAEDLGGAVDGGLDRPFAIVLALPLLSGEGTGSVPGVDPGGVTTDPEGGDAAEGQVCLR